MVGPKNGVFHHRRSGQEVSKLRLKCGLLLYLRWTPTFLPPASASPDALCRGQDVIFRNGGRITGAQRFPVAGGHEHYQQILREVIAGDAEMKAFQEAQGAADWK